MAHDNNGIMPSMVLLPTVFNMKQCWMIQLYGHNSNNEKIQPGYLCMHYLDQPPKIVEAQFLGKLISPRMLFSKSNSSKQSFVRKVMLLR